MNKIISEPQHIVPQPSSPGGELGEPAVLVVVVVLVVLEVLEVLEDLLLFFFQSFINIWC